jgi:hypothetical protein
MNMHWRCVTVALIPGRGFSQCSFNISLFILEINLILLCNCVYFCKTILLTTSVNTLFESSLLCYIMWCVPLKVIYHYRGTCHLHLQGWRINWARNWHDPGCKHIFTGLLFDPRDEATCSFKMSVDFQQTNIMLYPRRQNLYSHCCENCNPYRTCLVLSYPVSLIRRSTNSACNFVKPSSVVKESIPQRIVLNRCFTVHLTSLLPSVSQPTYKPNSVESQIIPYFTDYKTHLNF